MAELTSDDSFTIDSFDEDQLSSSDITFSSQDSSISMEWSFYSSEEEDETISNESSNDEMYQPVYPGAELTVLESYLLLFQYSLRHSLTKKAFSELLEVVGAHLPSGKMTSSYKLTKYFSELFSDINADNHYCCSNCYQPLPNDSDTCTNECHANALDFIKIPIGPQIKRRLEGLYNYY